jgi:hypothetical protein
MVGGPIGDPKKISAMWKVPRANKAGQEDELLVVMAKMRRLRARTILKFFLTAH